MNVFISPCDAKLTVYDVNEYSCFEIKNSFYSVKDLLNDDEIYKNYIGGKALVLGYVRMIIIGIIMLMMVAKKTIIL